MFSNSYPTLIWVTHNSWVTQYSILILSLVWKLLHLINLFCTPPCISGVIYKRKFGFDIRYFYKLIKADVRVTERKLMVKNNVRFKFWYYAGICTSISRTFKLKKLFSQPLYDGGKQMWNSLFKMCSYDAVNSHYEML